MHVRLQPHRQRQRRLPRVWHAGLPKVRGRCVIRRRIFNIASAVSRPQMAAIRYRLAAVTFVVSLLLLVWALCFCLRLTDFHFTRGWNKWGMQEYDLAIVTTAWTLGI